MNPLVGTYRTKDGRHIQLVFLEADRYWADFCQVIGRDDLLDDPRFADLQAAARARRRCVAELDGGVRHRTFAEWKACSPESTRRGRRCRRSRSCSTTRR